jgi:hypothetical protein
MLSNEERRHIAELAREQDRLLHEHHQWTAQRATEREAQARESEPEGIPDRTHEENAPAVAAEPSSLGLFGDERDERDGSLASILAYLISELRAERRAAIAELQKESEEDLDHRDSRLMNMLARYAFIAERAQDQSFEFVNRLTRLEQQIRELSEAHHKDREQVADIVELLPNWRRKTDAA